MSSTNRGRERSKFDYYVTPPEAIRHFLKHLHEDVTVPFVGPCPTVLDPCAGGDAESPMSYPLALTPYEYSIYTVDIREDSRADRKANYLDMDRVDVSDFCGGELPDIIISNPPFDLASEFIGKALHDAKFGGLVIMLCRLNFFGSGKRFPFGQNFLPAFTYVHSERMSFTKDGRTDSIEYAHMVWTVGTYPKFSKLRVI
jgi:hypothetical protein